MKVKITGSERVYYSQTVEMSEEDWAKYKGLVDDGADDDVNDVLEGSIDRDYVCYYDDLDPDASIDKP